MPSIILSDNGVSSGSAGLKSTAASDGVLILQTTTSGGTATNAIYVDTSQNVGVGVTPSAWNTFKGMQLVGGSLMSFSNAYVDLWQNSYYDGSNVRYVNTGYASYYRQNSGQHQWFTAASGTGGNVATFTQGMTLNASGQLLVGATTDYGFGGKILTRGGGVVSSSSTWDNSSTGGAIAMFCDNANYGTIWALKNGNTAWGDVAIAPSGGNLLVGTTTVAQTLSTNHYLTLRNVSGTPWGVGPTSSFGNFYVTNGGVGVYLSNGGTSWTSYSDERVKDIIEPITDAASKVSTLRAVIGKYKTDQDGVRRPFLIAQDVQAVLPEAVNVQGEDDDTLGLQYTDVIPLLVAAIKELKAELDTAKEQIAILQGAQQ